METLRILPVVDDPEILQAVAEVVREYRLTLADMGVDVRFEVAAPPAAASLANPGAWDIVLIDEAQLKQGALETLSPSAAHHLAYETIILTAGASLEIPAKPGVFRFLPLPFTPEKLKGVLALAADAAVSRGLARILTRKDRRLRRRFISVLAHELKAPLAAIEGYLHIIQEQLAGEDRAAYDRMIQRSLLRAEGMRSLINDLLDLTCIESGRKKRDFTTFNLHEIAYRCRETFLHDAQVRGITIAIHGPESLPFYGDYREIEILLNNLISNAVKYNHDNGQATLTFSEHLDTVTLTVADTGIGMTPAEAATLFRDFVRVKNKKTSAIIGSGLGLSIVKRIAAYYGGHIAVQSLPDQCTTFTVTLRNHYHPALDALPAGDDES